MDLDGTLLDHEERVHARDVAAIARAREQGVIVTIATGRLSHRTHPIASALQLDAPLICADGGVVACGKSQRVLRQNVLPQEPLSQLIELLAREGLASFAVSHDAIHSCSGTAARHGYLQGWSQTITTHDDMNAAVAACAQVIMLLAVGKHAQVEVARGAAQPLETLLDIDCFDVGDARLIRFVLKGTSKGAALSQLAGELGITREEIAVVGDWYNDLSMFEAAAHAYAMPHAPELVRNKASHVLPPGVRDRGPISSVLEHWLGQTF
jgi:Cof subfamily protein (haloacid dehalogenase superfamily)